MKGPLLQIKGTRYVKHTIISNYTGAVTINHSLGDLASAFFGDWMKWIRQKISSHTNTLVCYVIGHVTWGPYKVLSVLVWSFYATCQNE